ncbi:DUF4199 domain-containing protein [Riemerella anatipestifer]|uniref:DUF4199 domain-containing protein n=1 Tax=Riemerella anatipestifer TaxID=34085 RepID=A0AAP3EU57_RIEAN|nr:DUF4199 domain-containing protein [Riemerella anatipestifer]AZZ58071.1 DUF4199 domain-containing protein [Riemerella anatipestifer]MBT0551855.1 DUF4199 domain-containing protein [Riemerella anatipestifer]MBT0554061.1 DUF4199 domain-containing protein [Riemerella anatipestifer]MBT0572617.1 DUF4199 domain-containing protein [Riemerella anatipestifer]MCE3024660.1 DUF4199 domain-containing protein [Riemerella anatipestifer]
MGKSTINNGLAMSGAILLVFFVVYFFFMDVNYFHTTMIANSFVLPLIFGVGAFISVYSYKKEKVRLTFKEAFGKAFAPMFLAGFLSISSIFVFISYVDKDVKSLLNHQYIESFRASLEEEYTKAKQITKPNTEEAKELEQKYEEGKKRIEEKVKKKEDMFSLYHFSLVFAGYCAFFLILSVFFGSFFRSKTVY